MPDDHARCAPAGLAQRRQVIAALAQGRHQDLDHVQPVVQVLAEAAGLHVGGQVLVGGADHAHVHRLFLGGAERAHLPLLDGAQQLGLHGQRQVTDLVQEQRAAARGLEVALAVLGGAGVGALARAEKLGLQQVLRDGAAVHGHEGAVGAVAAGMQRARRQLLAGARFAADQHRCHAARHLGDALT
jgi:hypothetical protein